MCYFSLVRTWIIYFAWHCFVPMTLYFVKYTVNKDENIHRYAVRGEKREREKGNIL